jgi:threonine/homoserine/homoserine lactone efflux protein
MISLSQYMLFISVSILIILAPGPDIIFTITQGISRGRRAGLMTALGLAMGNMVHTLAVALGLSVIFRTSAMAFLAFKIFGACYLFYLAYRILSSKDSMISLEKGDSSELKNHRLIAKGFIMNVLNPKVALFFLAFLTQFTDPAAGSVTLQIVFLGATFIVFTAMIFGICGYFAGYVGGWLSRRPGFNRYMGYATSCIFIGLGVKLLLARR